MKPPIDFTQVHQAIDRLESQVKQVKSPDGAHVEVGNITVIQTNNGTTAMAKVSFRMFGSIYTDRAVEVPAPKH